MANSLLRASHACDNSASVIHEHTFILWVPEARLQTHHSPHAALSLPYTARCLVSLRTNRVAAESKAGRRDRKEKGLLLRGCLPGARWMYARELSGRHPERILGAEEH